jgi:hypothetical protein
VRRLIVVLLRQSFASIHVSKRVSTAGSGSGSARLDRPDRGQLGAWLFIEVGVLDWLVVAEGFAGGSRAEEQGCARA